MGHQFAEIAFTESVRDVQQALGSRANYSAWQEGEDYNHILGEREAGFIAARDSFYMASVSETGWPYIQHRGGPSGFMRVLVDRTFGFAVFSGNRLYVRVGNFKNNDRVSLFFMDYPNKTRLKLLGRVKLVGQAEPGLLASLEVDDYQAIVERGFVIHVEAFDWNCPQHITPRYTESQVDELVARLIEEEPARTQAGSDVRSQPPKVLGDGPLELVISGVRQLTPHIRAFELRDPNNKELPRVEAGSHLQVPVMLEDGNAEIRHYSICSNPARRDVYEIAVLRDDAGRGGSVSAHELFNLGLHLRCEMPQNHFRLHADDRPAVLIAGGIGITPIKAMAQALKARGSAMQLHYAGRNASEMAFRDRLLREFCQDLTLYRSENAERMNIESILADAPENAVFYICGPGRLIDAVSTTADELGINPTRIRFERFAATVDPDAKPLEVELQQSGKKIQVAADKSILDAMLEAGVDAPFGCRTGTCKSCAVKVLAGQPDHKDVVLTSTEREVERLMCPCVSRATSDQLVIDI
jgi:ferredoxin-NADP reductase/predicted pyridoxine 5'-phosphate oxidase superfamily flavin-nucleotide-binding protein